MEMSNLFVFDLTCHVTANPGIKFFQLHLKDVVEKERIQGRANPAMAPPKTSEGGQHVFWPHPKGHEWVGHQ